MFVEFQLSLFFFLSFLLPIYKLRLLEAPRCMHEQANSQKSHRKFTLIDKNVWIVCFLKMCICKREYGHHDTKGNPNLQHCPSAPYFMNYRTWFGWHLFETLIWLMLDWCWTLMKTIKLCIQSPPPQIIGLRLTFTLQTSVPL